MSGGPDEVDGMGNRLDGQPPTVGRGAYINGQWVEDAIPEADRRPAAALPWPMRPPGVVGTVTFGPHWNNQPNHYRMMMSGRQDWFASVHFNGELFVQYQEAVLRLWTDALNDPPDIPEATDDDFKRMTLKRLQPVEVLCAIRDALEPFAKMADAYDPDEGDGHVAAWAEHVTIGQLRAARRAYKALGFGRFALAPMALMDRDRPMETEAGKMTAAEEALNWLLGEKCDCDTGRPYSPEEARAIIEARIDYDPAG